MRRLVERWSRVRERCLNFPSTRSVPPADNDRPLPGRCLLSDSRHLVVPIGGRTTMANRQAQVGSRAVEDQEGGRTRDDPNAGLNNGRNGDRERQYAAAVHLNNASGLERLHRAKLLRHKHLLRWHPTSVRNC